MPPSQHVTSENVGAVYAELFAPWVQDLGLCDFEAGEGRVSARLSAKSALQFAGAVVCGQALMSAIDTIAALAMMTIDRPTKGTIYQHTHFLRPAFGEDFRIEVNVLRFGKTTAFAEARVTNAAGDLVAHATTEYAF